MLAALMAAAKVDIVAPCALGVQIELGLPTTTPPSAPTITAVLALYPPAMAAILVKPDAVPANQEVPSVDT